MSALQERFDPGALWHTRYQDVNRLFQRRMLHCSIAGPKFPLTRLGMPNTTPQLLSTRLKP